MPKIRYALVIEPAVLYQLRRITERDGISTSEQIRRGIDLWLKLKKKERKTR